MYTVIVNSNNRIKKYGNYSGVTMKVRSSDKGRKTRKKCTISTQFLQKYEKRLCIKFFARQFITIPKSSLI